MIKIAVIIACLFLTGYGNDRSGDFESLLGKFSKSYYDFFYLKMTESAKTGIISSVTDSSKLPKEDRIRFFTLIYLHYNLDGELFYPVRKAIKQNNDMDALIDNAKRIKSKNTYQDGKRIERFIKFLESIKKVHRIQ